MPTQEELDRLAEDLKYIKTAIQKSGSLLRWVAWKVPIRWVALVGGLVIIAIAFIVNQLQVQYSDFASVPGWIKAVLFGSIALIVVGFAWWKLRAITGELKKTGNEISYWQLFAEVYSRSSAIFIIPFLVTVAGMVIFLATRDLGAYIVPALAVLMGFFYVFFAVQFHFREMYGSSFWMTATGFICLFLDTVIGPMGALALTFGGSMIFLFVMTLFPTEVEWPGGPRG